MYNVFSIDNKYVEDYIDGYRLIDIRGREGLAYTITDQERPLGADGTEYIGKRQPSRTIVIKFSLKADTTAEFLARYQALKKLCQGENRKLRFIDVPNAHYTGTLVFVDKFGERQKSATGEMEFYCPDPHLISDVLDEDIAVAQDGILTARVDNEGSADVFPVYRIKHVTENGYLGIVHSGGALEVGNRDEVDAVPYQQSEMLADSFSPFVPYTGLNPENPLILNNGSLSRYADGYLRLSSAGTGTFYHGGSYKWDVPADSNGDIGAVNFYAWFRIHFETNRMGQTGLIQVLLADKNNKLIAGIGVQKNDTVGNKAYAQTWVGGNNPREVHNWFFEPTMWPEHNPFNVGRGEDDILKIGETIRFHYWGKYYEVIVPELKDVEVASVQVFIGQYGNRNASNQLVSTMGVGGFKGRKDFVAKQRDIPNRYSAGSEIVIDTSSDSITVDGLPANDELVDGSTFAMLPPGGTDIEFYPSAWCEVPPEVTVEYRKRWL